ncbi:ABC-type Mn2+/Zn2+ transport system ATPase subunit [Peptoniphilus olsenii]|uniref:ABC-type Mn2+/Zn2+ transport system ATPase subunit n=1 Tax=Peptoniphilus olsenii TaxID=411570 RepID=A0ABV2J8R2_9FIRM
MNRLEINNLNMSYKHKVLDNLNLSLESGQIVGLVGENGTGDSDIMMTDTINPLKSKFKGFHKTFKQDDLGLSLSSFLLN